MARLNNFILASTTNPKIIKVIGKRSSWTDLKNGLKLKLYSGIPEVYSEPSQTSRMELFAKTMNGWKLWIIFAKSYILDVRLGSEYVSVHYIVFFELDSLEVKTTFLIFTLLLWDKTSLFKKNWTNKGKALKVITDTITVFNSNNETRLLVSVA